MNADAREQEIFAETQRKQEPTIQAWTVLHDGHDWNEQECQGGVLFTCWDCDDHLWTN